ncbi:hypothetical protein PTRG_09506 [Pyrenophora tritici-repentis Pt-1C-BFP]|uniref:Uncharacterized protein n=1 Tax=Pyrenophora tritici-repentis (strain Pt-1C-BFP) TaxID=426418 RepID=B2WHP7_PYRTR|nr:uncharacterized protein PTRG_09506 [Pyrenophora tritici-repentis Pt-1C-BFP]EDU42557.1 hypothetical protein PTRG_09506 [Pyrenophora tritici-repentis Pt-1C-BFP]
MLTTLSLAAISGLASLASASDNTRLWYKTPAQSSAWTNALPIGNGRLGAMVFGIPLQERIALNEETIWSGGQQDRIGQDSPQTVSEVRDLLAQGRAGDAEKLANMGMMGTPQSCRNYQPLGDMDIFFDGTTGYDNATYKRWLDVDTALAGVQFQVNGTLYEREMFVSAPDDVFVHHLKATGSGKLSFQIRVHRPDKGGNEAADHEWNANGLAYMTGGAGGIDPIVFTTALAVQSDGHVKNLGPFIVVENATEATAIFAASTSYRHNDTRAAVESTIQQARQHTYEELRQRHIADYAPLYNASVLDLSGSDLKASSLPTDARINATREGASDPALTALSYNYGRYLLIASSRAGNLPSNLQGIWNKEFAPQWGSKYTVNINLQMNYWPAEVTSLSSLHEPLFDLLDLMRTDEHYWYTGDKAFLASKLDVVTEAIAFYLDILQPYSINGTQYLVTNPSVSPENSYLDADNNTYHFDIAPTCDIEILNELFTNYLNAVATLPNYTVDSTFLTRIRDTQAQLPPYRYSKRYPGTLQEWMQDYEQAELGHRHVSHLYALYPGTQILPPGAPGYDAKLFNAAAGTLEGRLSHNGAGTGWSRAWTINWYARLQNSTAVAGNVYQFFNTSVYNNLMDVNEGVFQIDGNLGFVSGVAEALIQSHIVDAEGVREVWLLPVLPEQWNTGSVNGLAARGGFVFDITWADGAISKMKMESRVGGTVVLRYKGGSGNSTTTRLETKAGDVKEFDFS